ncbi:MULTISPECIES: hypothetical protein [unclassified Neorhizobium]|uniref:hypothetical protein n=1 Tax=unclassified Neorhizobium TaxID=2629175 RepID=UPI001FF40E73|nr:MULTISPECIES: hypothetical protein [unclassified Neorhizobium]MCJ9669806.1 hypothetical protein [Neorhizobium sp. SHOUNA12B]MCJ9746261.1 hypothetical protein [Neorhizobium sp. SHOUNA12A]
MGLRVIEGGLAACVAKLADLAEGEMPSRDDVLREAERRIRSTGYETWRNRETMTGIPVPREIRYLAMQISFVAEAIGRLSDIPADFRSDFYWPA